MVLPGNWGVKVKDSALGAGTEGRLCARRRSHSALLRAGSRPDGERAGLRDDAKPIKSLTFSNCTRCQKLQSFDIGVTKTRSTDGKSRGLFRRFVSAGLIQEEL
jgi:hypothetical protein